MVPSPDNRPLWAAAMALLLPVGVVAAEDPTAASAESPEAGPPALRWGHSEVQPVHSEHLFGGWGGFRPRLAEQGATFSVEYLGEVLGAVSGGLDQGVIYEGLLRMSVDLDLKKLVSAPGTQFHVSGLYPHGNSLSEEYTGDLFTLSNIDAPDDPRLFELWLEQPLGVETFTLRFGALVADEEFAFTERGCLFINGTCGWPAIVGANVPSPAYPQAALGARLAWRPTETTFLQAAIYDGDPNPLDDAGEPTNPNGLDFTLDEGALIMVEGGFGWNQGSETRLTGNTKLGVWYHTGEFDHLHDDDAGLSLADPASSGVPESLNGNWGFYVVAEQTLWREKEDVEQDLGVFARVGTAPPDRSPVQYYAEAGMTRVGLLPGRDADTLGLAVVYGRLSDELRQFAGDANAVAGTSTPLPDYEMIIEAAYTFSVRPGWMFQPCLEYIVHPGGSAEIENALVVGLRTYFDF